MGPPPLMPSKRGDPRWKPKVTGRLKLPTRIGGPVCLWDETRFIRFFWNPKKHGKRQKTEVFYGGKICASWFFYYFVW